MSHQQDQEETGGGYIFLRPSRVWWEESLLPGGVGPVPLIIVEVQDWHTLGGQEQKEP